MSEAARAALAGITLGLVVVGCSGASPPLDRGARGASCSAGRLDACERAISAAIAEGRAARDDVAAYMDARAARDPADPWPRLYRTLASGPSGAGTNAAAIVEGSGPPAAARPAVRGIRWVDTAPLPRPETLDADALLLAVGEATGWSQLIHVRRQGRGAPNQVDQVRAIFPRDPLAPFLAGIAPIVTGDAAHLESDVAIATLIREAFDAAARFHYIDAARIADRLAAAVAGRDPFAETVLRGRYALQLLATAGVSLEAAEKEGSADAAPIPAPEAPAPAPRDTPYGDFLRVRTAKDEHAAWRIRSRNVLSGVPADRREALTALLGQARGCAPSAPPPMEDVRDLVFAPRLSGALAPADLAAPEAAGKLPLKAWIARYEALVRGVDQTGTMWSYALSVLYERGDALGMSPAGTPTYRRVSKLALSHVKALKELAEAEPARFRALSQIQLVYPRGLLADERLRDATIDLLKVTVQRKLAAADDVGSILGAVVTGVLAGMSYPAAVQPAHYAALQGAIAAKLRGDLTRRTGWGVAALYAGDAIYRVIADQAPNLPFSTAQIARALTADPAVPYPALAALMNSLARYAALGVDGRLDPGVTAVVLMPAERRAARAALRTAIAGLADTQEGAAPPPREGDRGTRERGVPTHDDRLLDDVTSLADGLIAVLTHLARAPAPAPAPATCAEAGRSFGPEARRAIAKLGDVRRRILSSARYRSDSGTWTRRARLLVTVLSDALDVLGRTGERTRFAIPSAEAEKNLTGALADWDEPALADALGGGYALARAALEAPSGDRFVQKAENGRSLRRVLRGLQGFLKKDTGDGHGAAAGVALLDALSTMPVGEDAAGLGGVLVDYAKAFSARGLHDQADMWLLSSLVASALAGGAPPPEALDHATRTKSRVAWVLRYLTEIHRAEDHVAPDPSAYAEGMRTASDDACATPDAGAVLAVMGAIRDFAAGRRSEARAALDRVLEDADARGLSVPRITYQYEEKTATRIFALTFNISYGAGLLSDPNSFQLGLGLRTRGEPEGKLTVALASDQAKSDDEAARYYVHAASLAAAYHFLEGDRERAAAAARRAASAVSFGVRLGSRAVSPERTAGGASAAWARDARSLLALDAELAAEAGLPLLAGDLWTIVRAALDQDTDDKAVAGMFDPLPVGLAAVKDIGAPGRDRPGPQSAIARTKRSLAVVAAPLPCTEAKVEVGAYEEPSCDTYPLALSLRVADVLKKLPHLRRGAGQCGPLRALNTFLTSVERGAYDPDAFTAAVEALRTDGRLYDAAVLLTRQRRDGHCNPTIASAARTLGRAPSLGPMLRSDLLSVAVNCSSATLSDTLVDDLMAIDDETRTLPDVSRNLRLVLFVTELSLREQRWDILARLTAQPDFVARWMKVTPNAATGALLIDQAAAALAPRPGPADPHRSTYELLCEVFPPGERAAVCAQIKALRAARGAAPEERRRLAKAALETLLSQK